jgi:hypothetical protein
MIYDVYKFIVADHIARANGEWFPCRLADGQFSPATKIKKGRGRSLRLLRPRRGLAALTRIKAASSTAERPAQGPFGSHVGCSVLSETIEDAGLSFRFDAVVVIGIRRCDAGSPAGASVVVPQGKGNNRDRTLTDVRLNADVAHVG